MSLMNGAAAKIDAYNRDAVLSASPVRLLTMLYDRLVLDLTRGEAALDAQNWPSAWENLRHADQIVAELASTLKVDAWDGADGLLQLYTYVTDLIVTSNIDRDAAGVREAISLIEPLRDTWHEAAAMLPADGAEATRLTAGSTPRASRWDPSAASIGEGRDLGVA
ncbi:flagellar export chaperone FliS [Leifsonia sp. NPDC058248]|uniref:flagellar export chaperone FliS n=1 Tax=Leifsonia sp. NPDC058248 TaxID=3346402 RepID=UPI0036D89E58